MKYKYFVTFRHNNIGEQFPYSLQSFGGIFTKSSLQIFGIVIEKVVFTFDVLSLSLCEINCFEFFIKTGKFDFM